MSIKAVARGMWRWGETLGTVRRGHNVSFLVLRKYIPQHSHNVAGEGEIWIAGFWPRPPLDSCVALAKTPFLPWASSHSSIGVPYGVYETYLMKCLHIENTK